MIKHFKIGLLLLLVSCNNNSDLNIKPLELDSSSRKIFFGESDSLFVDSIVKKMANSIDLFQPSDQLPPFLKDECIETTIWKQKNNSLKVYPIKFLVLSKVRSLGSLKQIRKINSEYLKKECNNNSDFFYDKYDSASKSNLIGKPWVEFVEKRISELSNVP